jgi:chromosome segregation ATPase
MSKKISEEEKWNNLTVSQMMARIRNPSKLPNIEIDEDAVKCGHRYYENMKKKKGAGKIEEEYKGHFLSLAKDVYFERLKTNALQEKVVVHDKKFEIVKKNVKRQNKEIIELKERIENSENKHNNVQVEDMSEENVEPKEDFQSEIRDQLSNLSLNINQVKDHNVKMLEKTEVIDETINKLKYDLFFSKTDNDISEARNEMLLEEIQKMREKMERDETKADEKSKKLKKNKIMIKKLERDLEEMKKKLKEKKLELALLKQRCMINTIIKNSP